MNGGRNKGNEDKKIKELKTKRIQKGKKLGRATCESVFKGSNEEKGTIGEK